VVVDTPALIPGVSTVDFTPLPSAISSTQILRAPHLTIDARVGAGRIDLMRAASRPS